jgi:NADPH:quinone reductase-like Zn-dependent oxidoreductase
MKRALIVSKAHGPEAIALQDLPEPSPAADEVRVRVVYAPIQPADFLLMSGRHIAQPELPATVGIEGVGVVDAVGAAVSDVSPGDAVALMWGGTWSEAVVVPRAALVPLRGEVPLEQASMLSLNPITASGLLEGVPGGSIVLQNAAASAVGKLVAALAKRRGIRVINVVRREEQVEEIRNAGGEALLDGDDLPERVRTLAAGAKVTHALDAVAGEASARLFSALSDGGTLVVYGLLSDDRVVLPAREVVFRDIVVRGYGRLRAVRELPRERLVAICDEWLAWLRAGGMFAEVEAIYPLDRVKDAVSHADRQGRRGKILLACSEGIARRGAP